MLSAHTSLTASVAHMCVGDQTGRALNDDYDDNDDGCTPGLTRLDHPTTCARPPSKTTSTQTLHNSCAQNLVVIGLVVDA